MIKKTLWVFLVSLLVTTLLLVPITPVQAESESTVDVLVTFYQQPGAVEVSLIQGFGGTVIEVYHIVPTILATIPVDELDALRSDPRVKSIEEDQHLQSILAAQELPWGVDRVDAEQVHPTNKGTGIKVAVLDTGIDLDHPDLAVAGNITFVDGTSNGDDDNGHGTAVAGIIGALDNDIGVIGVAPEAALYSVKVLNYSGSGLTSWILSGIQWAKDNGMQVINMSFGSLLSMPSTIVTALDNAYSAGIVLVAGAGNGGNAEGTGNNIWAPARYMSVIAAGATDSLDNRWSSSSTGYQLEVMAPGVDIYTTAMSGGYANFTGTSASSPHVSGAAALLIHSGITDNIAVRNRLRNSATDLGVTGWDPQYGCGLVNIVSALNFSEPPDQTPPVTTISLSGTVGNNGWYKSDVTVTLSAVDSGSGVALTKYSADGGLSWNTYTSPFVVATEGWDLVVLGRSWDNAGNDEGPLAFVNYKMDKTLPILTETVNPTLITSQQLGIEVSVHFVGTAEDSLSGIDAPLDHSLIDEYSTYSKYLSAAYQGDTNVEAWNRGDDLDGRTYTFRFTAFDAAGNTAYVDAITTVQDFTPPVTTISTTGTMGNNEWYVSDVTVTLSAVDNSTVVFQTEYSLDGGSVWNVYTSPFLITTDTANQGILARSRDNAGNIEDPPVSANIKVDKTPPILTETVNPTLVAWQQPGTEIWVNYVGTAEDSLSGMDAPLTQTLIDEYGVYSKYLGAGYEGSTNIEAWSRSDDFNGRTYTFRFTGSDIAGNTTFVDAIVTVQDMTSPVTTISTSGTQGNNGWYLSDVTVTLSAVDNCTGVYQTEYSLDGGSVWNTYSSPFLVATETANQGILARSRDNAGNIEDPPVSANIKIDKTPPTVTEVVDPTQMKRIADGVTVNVSYTGTAEDLLSGLSTFQMDLIDAYGEYSTSLTSYTGIATVEAWCTSIDRVYTFRFTMFDVAGNSATVEATFTVTKK